MNTTMVAHTLKGEGHDASEYGTGRGVPLVADCIGGGNYGGGNMDEGVPNCFPINTQMAIHRDALTGTREGLGVGKEGDPAFTLQSSHPHAVSTATQVRRLTPRECEFLQGFPPDFTLIEYRGKPAADGNRYKALGNSMAVNVMRWIGDRIDMVDKIEEGEK